MKVCLIEPSRVAKGEIAQDCFPPVTLLWIATAIREAGHEVLVLDQTGLGLEDRALLDMAAHWGPDLLGINVKSRVLRQAYALSELAGILLPGVRQFVLGRHVTFMPDAVVAEFGQVAYAVRGEAEEPVLRLIDAVAGGTPFEAVPGLVWIDARTGGLRRNGPDYPQADLLRLGLPARDLLRVEYQRKCYYMLLHRGRPVDKLITTRGFTWDAGYARPALSEMRFRPVEHLLDELEQMASLGINHVAIDDSAFAMDEDRVNRFFEDIVRARFPLTFQIKARALDVTEEMLGLAFKAGVRQVSYAMESGNQKILDRLKLGVRLEDYTRAIKLTKAAGILCHTEWNLGFPGETPETVMKTINFVVEHRPNSMALYTLTPYPETEVYRDAKDKGKLVGDWSVHMTDFPWIQLPWVNSRRDLDAYTRLGNRYVYFRPHYLWNLAKLLWNDSNLRLAGYAWQQAKRALSRIPERT
ncbi:MAG: B12-binding domain-containing radical SAM protein, partial [Candidatus Methylomirabilis sp.]|nr:B12-binding domain-containing radical SAM protein [Deltaproteobacteria bacterium]